MFVFVVVKDGQKSKLHVRAKDIDAAFQTAGKIDGEVLEIFSFDKPVDLVAYSKIFNLRKPILPAGIPGEIYQDWVPERYA